MSLVTVSDKRDRVYDRAFDHDEARELRAQGWSYNALADHFGVCAQAVRRVCDQRVREAMNEAAKDYARRQRKSCRGGCGALVWAHNARYRENHTGYCPSCRSRPDTEANVRDGELCCTKCGERKPDEEFHKGGAKRRRNRRSWCKTCDHAARRALRADPFTHERERQYDNTRKRKKAKTMAMYCVLRKNDDGTWEEAEEVQAASRLHAVEACAEGPGTYAAVLRSHLEEMHVAPVQAFKVVKNGSAPEA